MGAAAAAGTGRLSANHPMGECDPLVRELADPTHPTGTDATTAHPVGSPVQGGLRVVELVVPVGAERAVI